MEILLVTKLDYMEKKMYKNTDRQNVLKKFVLIVAFSFVFSMYFGNIFVEASIPSNVVSGYLSGNYIPQQKSCWCWVASAENACI